MPKPVVFIRNLLILATLIALVLFGWLVGHILRYSTPGLWHPPIREINPYTEFGWDFEFAGIPRLVVLPGRAAVPEAVRFEPDPELAQPTEKCLSTTYYTSLPAKCWTADGRFVRVSVVDTDVFEIPQRK